MEHLSGSSIIPAQGRGEINGAGLSDLHVLNGEGLVGLAPTDKYSWRLWITPRGFDYDQRRRAGFGHPLVGLQGEVRSSLDADEFVVRHPAAHAAWSRAVTSLWSENAPARIGSIGHDCREALQAFATDLVAQSGATADADTSRTKNRVRAAITARQSTGSTSTDTIDALVAFVDALVPAIQQTEHAGQKEGNPLIWEDARRVTFLVGVAMYELGHFMSLPIAP